MPLHCPMLCRVLCLAGERLAALDSLAGGRYPHMAAVGVAVQGYIIIAAHLRSLVPNESVLRMLRSLQLLLGSGTAWLRSGPRSAAHKFGADPADTMSAMTGAVNDVVAAVHSYWPGCVDSLSATAAPPALLVGWLAALVEAVEAPQGVWNGMGA